VTEAFDMEAAVRRLEAAAARSNQRPLVPGVQLKDQRLAVTLAPNMDTGVLRPRLEQLGFAYDDYEIEKVTYRDAGGTEQVKVELKPRAWRLQPARIPGPSFAPLPVEHVKGAPRLVAFCGDQQRPYDDPRLHEAFLRWIEAAKPSEIVNLGDLPNFTSVGNKHRWNPGRTPDPMKETQVGVDESYQWWLDVSQAGGESLKKKVWLEGNHELHLVKAMIEAEFGRLYDIRRAGDPDGHGVMALQHLCRTDELGVEYVVDPLGGWPRGKYRVCEYAYAKHGSVVRPGAGQSVWSAIQNINYTLFVGHVHRGAIVSRTVWDRDESHRTIYGVEVPGMHLLGQQGYEPEDPDQQQGFATFWVYPDGTYTPPQLGSWNDGALRWGTMTIEQTTNGFRVTA
jgi:hypothetical protein